MTSPIGSNMDVPTIVNELMKRQMTQLTNLSREEKTQEIKLSLYGQLKNTIDKLNQSFTNLTSAFNTLSFITSVGNSSVISASVSGNSNIFAGTHQINVTALASAKTVSANNQLSSRNQALSMTGDLTFTVDGKSFAVNVASSDSLDMIRDKVNQSSSNMGVTASVLATTDQNGAEVYTLVIASNKTGIANDLNISGSLASNFDFTNIISSAADAAFTIDGKSVVRNTNTVTDVLDGVTINLNAIGQSSLTVAQDNTNRNKNIVTSIQGLLDAYNGLMDFIDQNKADRSLTDSTVDMIRMQVQNLFAAKANVTGQITSLMTLGVKTTAAQTKATNAGSSYVAGNRIEINADKLEALLASDMQDVQMFFNDKDNGFIAMTKSKIAALTNYDGLISNTTKALNESITRLNRSMDQEESRLELMKDTLTAKYSLLAAMMDKYDRLSTVLEQTFKSMSISGKK